MYKFQIIIGGKTADDEKPAERRFSGQTHE